MTQQYFIADYGTPRDQYIKRVRVIGLFNEWTYEKLGVSEIYGGRLAILAGSNGTGKTTILRLIRAALYRDPARQKTSVHGVSFKLFELELFDGLIVGFERDDARTGPFTYFLKEPTGKVHQLQFRLTPTAHDHDSTAPDVDFEDDSIMSPESPEEAAMVKELAQLLSRYAPRLVYLPTNREEYPVRSQPLHRNFARTTDPLQRSVNSFMSRIQVRARRESNDAEVAAFDVLSRTVEATLAGREHPASKKDLIAAFREQMQQIEDYARIGLTRTLDANQLISKLEAAGDEQFGMIAEIVAPYLDSQKARLHSVRDSYGFINQFIESMNAFFTRKTVRLNLLEGLTIYKGTERLPLRALSSGERQLLGIFTSATARGPEACLVLIDEPELSLNSNWTRMLIRRLLSEALTSDTQFILATHSIELSSQFDDAVLQLDA